jgi:hypothetical protein
MVFELELALALGFSFSIISHLEIGPHQITVYSASL